MKVYCVIESNYSHSDASCYNEAIPMVYLDMESAKRRFLEIIEDWKDMGFEIHRGQGEGEKWTDIRWDSDDRLAYIDCPSAGFHRVEIYTVEVPVSNADGDTGVSVVDRWNSKWKRTFKTAAEAEDWLLDGMASCEGAERDHYVNMMMELKGGAKILHTN